MAPLSSDNDFLDDALKNRTLLPSWRSIFARLSSPNPPSPITLARITTFLTSKYALHMLSNCHDPFPAASDATKQEFEKRTAPINFTAADQPTADGVGKAAGTLPAIAELKRSALEFSKAIDIDEVAALRIVVLEYQMGPAKALLAAEAGAGSDPDIGPGNFGVSFLESVFKPNQVDDQKQKDEQVFYNRLEVYLSERRYLLKVATSLIRAVICRASKNNVWHEIGQQFLAQGVVEWPGFASKLIDGIELRWKEVKPGGNGLPKWVETRMDELAGDQILYTWEKQKFLEIIHSLQLLFLLFYKLPEQANALLVMRWFNFMMDTKFLTEPGRPCSVFPRSDEMNNFYDYTGGLASVISLAVLQLPSASDAVEDDFTKSSSPESSATPPVNGPAAPARPASTPSGTLFYIRDSNAIKTITTCIQQCPSNPACSPAAMGWVYLLNTIQSLMLINTETEWNEQDGPVTSRSVAAEFYGNLLPGLFPTTVDVGIKNLAEPSSKPMLHVVSYLVEPSIDTSSGRGFCLNCEEDGFRMKNVLADLVRKSQPYIEFSAPLISTTFLVNGVEYSEISDFRKFLEQETCEPNGGLLINDWSGSPSNRFYLDHGALKLLDRAKNRFPYEPLPLLKIVRGLATENSATIDFLTHMTTYTHSLPYGFKDYDDVGDPETGRIQLHSDLVLFPPRDGDMFENSSGQYLSSGGIIIPSGTIGVQISSGSARQVVAWQYGYNALSLFGRVLECALVPQQRTAAFADLCSAEVVNAIISLLTGLVVSSKEAEDAVARVSGHYTIPPVLEEASDMLGRNRDIISIVFDIIDRELNCYSISGIPFITGIEFINSLVHVVPGRVWPYLARSSLLERHGRGGALAGIVSAVEVVHGSYEFTLACLVLFESLVDEAVRSSAIHKGQSKSLVLASKAALATSGTAGMGVSDIVQRGILLGFTRVAVGIFESYRGFKYTKTIQKLKIGTIIARTFSSILEYVYGVDEFSDSENKITSVLTPCAEYLVSVFLSAGISELPLEPIFGAITDGVQTPESSLYLRPLEAWVEQVTQIVKLADVLVRVRLYLELPPSQLEKNLYAASAPMAKLYAAHDTYKRHVLELFESLVKCSRSFSEEPPSLLGHLGRDCANHFVSLLSCLDRPYQDEGVETRIWQFMSAVVSNKQQGMSILLLRGEALRQGNHPGKAKEEKKKSMLAICFDALEDIEGIPVEKVLAMLEMVSTAQNFWSLAMDDLGKHPKLLPGLTRHVENIAIEFLPADSKEIITEKAYKIAVAAYVARILALYLHSRRPSERDEGFFKQLLPRLNFYFEKAVKISGYRPSLHAHLQKNFEEKWPGAKLAQFKKTRLKRADYGPDAVYDLELGDKILGFDLGWGGRADGYRNEVEQANLNLSLVQTQVDLLSSWELLAVELCDFVKNSQELARSMVRVVETCLQENMETGLPAPIFTQILSRRAEFAFIIIRKLHQALPGSPLFSNVFKIALKATTSSVTEFRSALSSANMDYYRSLLRMLYISLTAFAKEEKHSSQLVFDVLDVLDLVVTKGFKDLAQSAHQYPNRANPQDIALVTGILQVSLRIKNLEEIHKGLIIHLQQSQTIRAATTLFSWAEKLAGENGDPVYGELAVLFLLELSSIPLTAELLAADNILELLMSTTLAASIAQGVTPASHPRLHAIWSRGLLPLALNLLANVGQRFGRPVVTFLKFFLPQIKTAIEGWQKPTTVVLPAVNEVLGISMMLAIVARMGGQQELQQINIDTTKLLDGIDYLLTHKNYLKSLVAATSVEEEEMLKGGEETPGGLVEKVITGLQTVHGLLQDTTVDE